MLSIISGPSIVTGNLNPVQNNEPDQGPSLYFQGAGIVDPRFVGQIGSALGSKIYGIYDNSYVSNVDAIPVVSAVARIAVGQATTAGTPLTLLTTQGSGIATVPMLPINLAPIQANIVNAMALDYGFCPCSVVGGTKTMTIPAGAWRFFSQGAKICVAGAATATTALFTTVASAVIPGTTTITMADNAGVTAANTSVGDANPTVGINVVWPYTAAGAIAMFDSTEAVSRAVSITSNAGATAQSVTVRGYDVYGAPMTETIAFAGGAVTTNGKKAFKYITSVTPSVTDATHLMSVGTTDIIGLAFRSDFWEYLSIYVAGTLVAANTGWVLGDVNTATATTGDVRGTYALQTASNWDGTVANWATSRKTSLFSTLPLYNIIGATNLNSATLYGNTQFAG